eukprot:Nitzschia sp. Nitz4//scaffold16_size188269//4951//5967//NITZ4_001762-RA/size188269-processed-gene-0.2-mRNA-1//1//CDS//3329538428//128//frame0
MGDFSRNFHRPDAGSHTVEGNVSGSRAMMLERQRQADQEAFQEKKRQAMSDTARSVSSLQDKFKPSPWATAASTSDSKSSSVVGLVSVQEFVERQKEQEAPAPAEKNEKPAAPSKKKKKKKLMRLSFDDEQEEEEEIDIPKSKKSKKDPTVDTSFLPDAQREQELAQQRVQLEQEWTKAQERIRQEPLEITYSYWDGSGHRRTCQVKKGSTIGEFLEVVRQDLLGDFRSLASVAADGLLYVKEDLILPSDVTFYDLIVTKARGKSGPLFHFDVHEDVRLGPVDSRVEKDESHPGKVVERSWYERNKHIFPASRWEIFDPAKDYGSYTIHGGELQSKKK